MDRKQFRIRPFSEDDYPALSRILSQWTPELPTSSEDQKEWDGRTLAGRLVLERWVVEERPTGEVVAIAAISQSRHTFDPNKFWASVNVDPAFRRRGIGRALVELLEGEAVDHHAKCFWADVRKDDEPSRRFAERSGFDALRTIWLSVLDLGLPPSQPLPDRSAELEGAGIRFTTLANEGAGRSEIRKRIHELWEEAARDVPRMGKYTPVSFADFETELDSPTTLPEGFFLAASGDAFVASTHLVKDLADPAGVMIGFTGTRPAFRGRGIATELKRRSLDFARERGFRFVRTFNDSENAPIWAINEKLGFRRGLELLDLERRFPGADSGRAHEPSPGAGRPSP